MSYQLIINRTGVTAIRLSNSEECIELPTSDYDAIFRKYLDNQYSEIVDEIPEMKDVREQLYYQVVLNPIIDDIKKEISIDASNERGYVGVVLQKIRERLSTITFYDRKIDLSNEIRHIFQLMPSRYEDAVYYLNHISSSMSDIIVDMEKILDDQEKRYEYGNKTWYSNNAFFYIWKLQSYAYEYYFFIKGNYLPIDRYSDIKTFLSYYLRAILCTYSPINHSKDSSGFGIPTHREPYPLSEIEVDMFVKYTDPKSFQLWLKKYSVQKIVVNNDINMVIKVDGLCRYFRRFRYKHIVSLFDNLFTIISLSDISKGQKLESLSLLINMFGEMIENHQVDDLFGIIEKTYFGIKAYKDSSINLKLVSILINEKAFEKIHRGGGIHNRIMKKTGSYVSVNDQTIIIARIRNKSGKEKTELAYLYRSWLPVEVNKEIWSTENISDINKYLDLIVENIVEYSDDFLQKAIEVLDNEVVKKKNNPNVRAFPDYLTETIDTCLLVKMLGFPLELQQLEKYKEYSEYLQFMLSPEEFDYSTIDLNDYMWQNLVYSKEYREYFKSHKTQVLTEDLKTILRLGLASKDQQKIVYGILLDDSQLFEY